MLEPKKGGEEQRNKHYAVIPMTEYHWWYDTYIGFNL